MIVGKLIVLIALVLLVAHGRTYRRRDHDPRALTIRPTGYGQAMRDDKPENDPTPEVAAGDPLERLRIEPPPKHPWMQQQNVRYAGMPSRRKRRR